LKVVCNSSVLINLCIIGELKLLKEKFRKIIIPKAVWQEVVEEGKDKPAAEEVKKSEWIKVKKLKNKNIANLLKQNLDNGEAESIALAIEIKTDIILLDERDARKEAEVLNLKPLGVIGILIWAKKKRLIKNFKNKLQELRDVAKFRFSEELFQKALNEVGE
jgi:hypothetical protein